MRIAITTSGDSPDSFVDGRFTTARYIIVFDVSIAQWETVKFSLWSRQQKFSGQIRANILKEKGVTALISGGVDPVSFRELAKRNISIYQAPDCLVREAAEMLVRGRLRILQTPDAIDVNRLLKKTTIKF